MVRVMINTGSRKRYRNMKDLVMPAIVEFATVGRELHLLELPSGQIPTLFRITEIMCQLILASRVTGLNCSIAIWENHGFCKLRLKLSVQR
jgi:hypothetical protein